MDPSNFAYDGDSIEYTPAADVTAGDVIAQNDMVAVAKVDIAANVKGALAIKGVFDVPKDTGSNTDIDAGEKVYWDDSGEVATTTSSANVYMGKAVVDADTDDETVRVRLEQ